jgi:paraquat-inducible protein B
VSRRVDPVLIGAFVLGAVILAITAILLLAGGEIFRERREHVMYFEGAAQGLQAGAPVMFLGVKVGKVRHIRIGLDEQSGRFIVPVTVEIEPNIVRTRNGEAIDLREPATLRRLVDRGLRARLRMQSILTGQLYVALDFHPERPAVFVSADDAASEIPTIRTAIQELTTRLESFPIDDFLADVAGIAADVRRIAADPATADLPRRLRATLERLEAFTARLETQIDPTLGALREDLRELRATLAAARGSLARVEEAAGRVAEFSRPGSEMVSKFNRAADDLSAAAQAVQRLAATDSAVVSGFEEAVEEISKAARALRSLSETLEEQPQAILWGKREHRPDDTRAPERVTP